MTSSGSGTQVVDYYLSVHMAMCHGPVDNVSALIVGEKVAWEGTANDNDVVRIDNKGLFGGSKSEGGVFGDMTILNGGSDQVVPENFAAKLGGTPATVPGFRGFLSLLLTGVPSKPAVIDEVTGAVVEPAVDAFKGFMWGSNSAYIKSLWLKITRRMKFSGYLGYTPSSDITDTVVIGPDTNPAWIIYETLVNKSWGMGTPISLIDFDSFVAVAKVLKAENFGMSLVWADQTAGDEFITSVLNHINGVCYSSPYTGKTKLRILRDDYDIADLPVMTADDCKVTSMQRKSWSETVNELIVKYTNPENEELVSVGVHNLANISVQGGIVSQTNEYAGIRNAELAVKVASRDLRLLSSPLIGLEVEVNRKAWRIEPGDVVVLDYPELDITGGVFRVGPIDYGNAFAQTIKLTLTEDMFSAGTALYSSQEPLGVSDNSLPSAPDSVYLTSSTYAMVARTLGTSAAESLTYPTCPVTMLVAESDNIYSLEVVQHDYEISGDTSVGDCLPQVKYTLGDGVGFTASSTLTLANKIGTHPLKQGDMLLIGSTGNVNLSLISLTEVSGHHPYELCHITAVIDHDTVIVDRGCFDTVPYAWSAGVDVWVLSSAYTVIAPGGHAIDGVDNKYLLYPRNTNGQLKASPVYSVTGDARMYYPYRPANVKINGNLYPASTTLPINITWSSRNRLIETASPNRWTDGSVVAETGETYQIRVVVKVSGYIVSLATLTQDTTVCGITNAWLQSELDLAGAAAGRTYNVSGISEISISLVSLRSQFQSHAAFKWRCAVTQ